VSKEFSERDAETVFSVFGNLRAGTRIYFDRKANKRMAEVEFMLHEDAVNAFSTLKSNLTEMTVAKVFSNGMGRQGEQERKRTLRIRAGGLPRGSAIVVCKDGAAADEVATILNGQDIGYTTLRARPNFKKENEVRLDGLTESEDEATLFDAFTILGIVPHLHDQGRCIILHVAPGTHKDDNDVSTWFQSKLRGYGEIQKLEVRSDRFYLNAEVTFRSEASAQAAKSALHTRTDLFDSPTLPCVVTEIQPTAVFLLHEVATKFQADLLTLVNDFNSPTRTHRFQASLNGSNIYVKPIGNGQRSQLAMLSATGDEIKDFLNSISTYSSGIQIKMPATAVFTAFSQGSGLQFIKNLQTSCKVVVKHQTVGNVCVIYGPARNVTAAEADLQKFVKSIESFVVEAVPIAVPHFAMLLRSLSQDINKLRANGDRTTSISFNRERSVLTLIGEQAHVDHIAKKIEAVKMLSVGGNLAPPPSQFASSGCTICNTSVVSEDDRLRVCGHTICRQCLHDHFLSATVFPVKCPGGTEQRCAHAIPLYDAWRVLEEDERIEVSQHCILDMMARQRKMGVARRYRVCPTPGCPQLYVASKAKFKCDTCGQKYCIACSRATGKDPLQVKNHVGETCEEYQQYNGAGPSGTTQSTLPHMGFSLGATMRNFNINLNNNTMNNNLSSARYSTAQNTVPPPASLVSLPDGTPLQSYSMCIFFYYLLFIIYYYLLFIIYYLLFIIYYLLFIIYYL
jgi:hypothetical protein